jgi:hypothetical protein
MTAVGGNKGGVQKGRSHDYIPMIQFVTGLSALLPVPYVHRHCEDNICQDCLFIVYHYPGTGQMEDEAIS